MIILAVALLAAGYYWSYRFATVRVSHTGHQTLHVAGLSFDYNEVNARRFSRIFGLLLEQRFEQIPETTLDATFSQLWEVERSVYLRRKGQGGILIRYGPEHEKAVRTLLAGDPVTVTYKSKSVPENLFVSCYQITRISKR